MFSNTKESCNQRPSSEQLNVNEQATRRLEDDRIVDSSYLIGVQNTSAALCVLGKPGSTQYEMNPYVIPEAEEPETQ